MNQENIRNFCIIAHIDHGKSTLADRIIEKTGLPYKAGKCRNRCLIIWILKEKEELQSKFQTVRTVYKAEDGQEYIFNLIDTPSMLILIMKFQEHLQRVTVLYSL